MKRSRSFYQGRKHHIIIQRMCDCQNLALVANGKLELQETMEEWNGLFTKHGLKMNLEKTGVLHIGHQREELDIEL